MIWIRTLFNQKGRKMKEMMSLLHKKNNNPINSKDFIAELT